MNNPESETFNVGTLYSNLDDAKTAILKYNVTHFTNFTITNNNANSLVCGCKHGRLRNSKSIGKRPNQHYNFLGCSAIVRMYKSKDGQIKYKN